MCIVCLSDDEGKSYHTENAIHCRVILLDSIQKNMRIPVDVLVTSVGKVREWGHLPGTVLYEALHEGEIVCEFS